ncbi:hypothetical protein BpHYR1_002239 [Brachionus plicatilis]|uniref:Uncharacterized protein n=1 Tax=Brachionus plicatilis TaxID=10195 RepID=A0A3M7SEL9_BRAPC|nr:hypothetical protein BpHYR1_002239 [Brachionus plicatilis]
MALDDVRRQEKTEFRKETRFKNHRTKFGMKQSIENKPDCLQERNLVRRIKILWSSTKDSKLMLRKKESVLFPTLF